ncbi:carbohydrate ABC transporter substrate-binding protein [Lacrimispora algidixylanolytica]|uniref:ABC transporter substrate-binding protein n=1 Tax=Lacrimispora algidixylanolytica TaxID=94868 RepID=A0A419SUF3_9FIRM|nr:carbohydrate ABC transporter substrate-binding protein [Lacrimispora algidixylanolytica]RKD28917.1 ABC transporter substrate-binding protein [Lacrimispora algidixylanolytica]
MKKKVVSGLLCAVMVASLTAGCGAKNTQTQETTKGSATAETTSKGAEAQKEEPGKEGKVVNIYVWNDEFKARYEDYYASKLPAGYTVNFVTTPSENNAYQNALDEALLNQADAKADDKVDMFLVEADYILKYVNSDSTLDLKEVGITEQDMSKQFDYTKVIAQDTKGAQKGISWQGCPGLYIYRRSIAKEVLGTDDPAEVQKAINDWDTFDKTAAKMKDKGFYMVSGFDDSYRTFSNNVSGPWVNGDKVVIDPKIEKWIEQTKNYTDKGYNQKTVLWAAEWASGQGPDSKVFGYFMPAWGVDFVMAKNSLAKAVADGGKQEVGNGTFGDWAATTGPESYNWGGTWLCAASGTDNADIVADIMKTICTDDATMKKIVEEKNDFANNKTVMQALAKSDYKSQFLGGQNPLQMFYDAAEKIDMSKISPYDQGLNESIQTAMHDYFNGTVDKDTAMKNFYTSIKEKYPELKTE